MGRWLLWIRTAFFAQFLSIPRSSIHATGRKICRIVSSGRLLVSRAAWGASPYTTWRRGWWSESFLAIAVANVDQLTVVSHFPQNWLIRTGRTIGTHLKRRLALMYEWERARQDAGPEFGGLIAGAAKPLSQSLQYTACQYGQTGNLNAALQWIAPVIALDIPARQLIGATAASAWPSTATGPIGGERCYNLR